MPEPSTGELVSRLSEQLGRLVRAELQLAQQGLAHKVKPAGIGAGLVAAGGVLALVTLGELVAAATAALALVLSAWAAALIIGGAVLLLAGLLVVVTGLGRIKRGSPSLPTQAIANIKRDLRTVKESAHR
jgi:hypothetical protein